jgi:hypothetical protein
VWRRADFHARRRRTATTGASNAVETARRDAAVVDVAKDAANSALEDEVANATGVVVAMDDGGFNSIGDRIHHGIHGRYGVCHLLP